LWNQWSWPQICEELTIDAAVTADDGKIYVFKIDYYWEFDSDSSISKDIGKPVKERWIDSSAPIDAPLLSMRNRTEVQLFLYKYDLNDS
jgi:hypothetical protein